MRALDEEASDDDDHEERERERERKEGEAKACLWSTVDWSSDQAIESQRLCMREQQREACIILAVSL